MKFVGMKQRQQPTKQMHIICIFFTAWLQGQNIQSLLGNEFEVVILDEASPSKTKVWLASALTEDHAQHAHLQKYGEENSAKSGAKKLAWLHSNEIQAEHVIY
jgi:hypothetical protein